jgi:hypothetical protein
MQILENWTAPQLHESQIDAGSPEQAQFGRFCGFFVDTQQAPDAQTKARRRKRAIRRRTAESPASRIIRSQIARGGTHDHKFGRVFRYVRVVG